MSPPLPSPPSPLVSGLTCRCPRCGRGPIYAGGLLDLAITPKCSVCRLDLAFVDPGDGPAVFVIMILGVLLLGLALFVEFTLHPPFWLLLTVFGPLTLLTAIGLLRPVKALLIAQQFHTKAAEGQLLKD